MTYSV